MTFRKRKQDDRVRVGVWRGVEDESAIDREKFGAWLSIYQYSTEKHITTACAARTPARDDACNSVTLG